MYRQRIKEAISQLGLISALLVELDCDMNVTNTILNGVGSFFHQEEDLQLNPQKKATWSEKEIKEMPCLKNLKYRLTKDGIHQFRYRRNGYDVAFSSKNYDQAKRKARDFVLSLKKQLKKKSPEKVNLFSLWANKWFDIKRSHANEGTVYSYLSAYKNHIEAKFGFLDVSKILPMDIQPFFDDLSTRLGKTSETCRIVMNGIFDLAVANRACPSNPMKAVVIEKHVRKQGKALSSEEIVAFKSRFGNVENFGLAYLIILYTGIRGFELQSLTFDWNDGTFTVKNAKLKKSQKMHVENLTRTVPIFNNLFSLRDRISSEDWRIAPKKLSNWLSKNCDFCSVKDLRHTFTTIARESGVENELVNL